MRLYLQVKKLQKEKDVLIDGINEIQKYLNLPKFALNTNVNKQDIFNRFEDIRNNLHHMEL